MDETKKPKMEIVSNCLEDEMNPNRLENAIGSSGLGGAKDSKSLGISIDPNRPKNALDSNGLESENSSNGPGSPTDGLKNCSDIHSFLDDFDKKSGALMSIQEFEVMCHLLFQNKNGVPYEISEDHVKEMFEVWANKDGFIDRTKFQRCKDNWVKTILNPVSAIVVVDVQNDFISGSLSLSNCSAKQNGYDVIAPINKVLSEVTFHTVFYSLDWHPSDHISFIDNVKLRQLHKTSPIAADSAKVFDTVIFDGSPPIEQRLWPRHCVQDSWGSELHKDLKIIGSSVNVYKGTNPEIDSYSAFYDNQKRSATILNTELAERKISDVYVCGLAYDVCVGATTIDAMSCGYRTILVDDGCRGVDLKDIERVKKSIQATGGVIAFAEDVKHMVEGRDRRPELGYQLAMKLRSSLSNSSLKNIK